MTPAYNPSQLDSTRIRTWTCKRKFYYSHVRALEPRGATPVDLVFGDAVHRGLEAWEKRVARGEPNALEETLEEFWVETQAWDEGVMLPPKDRAGLFRLLTWYVEQFPSEDDPVRPLSISSDGRLATEVPFRVSLEFLAEKLGVKLPYLGHWPEPPKLVGRLDGLVSAPSGNWIRDRKSSRKHLSGFYFDQYAPNIQFSIYDMVGQALLPELALRGVMLEAMQVGVNFARFARVEFERFPGQAAETLVAVARVFREMSWAGLGSTEELRVEDFPLNESACMLGGRGCEFRALCNSHPALREDEIKRLYQTREIPWDPLASLGHAILEG